METQQQLEPVIDKPAGAEETITCAKCGAINPKKERHCQECKAHLYLRCHYCHARNDRHNEECTGCGRPLRASALGRFTRKFKTKTIRRAIRKVKLGLSIAMAFALLGLIYYFLVLYK